jgi:hypothetical protein
MLFEEAMGCLQRIIEFTAKLEALPLLGAAKEVRARLHIGLHMLCPNSSLK